MELERAREFIREHHQAVMSTRRADGSPQMSPIACGVDADGNVIVSTREPAIKTKNVRRDPNVSICVLADGFYGDWIQVDGTATVVSLPDAMELLVEYYRSIRGEHPDWDDYRAAMEREQRVVLRIALTRAGVPTAPVDVTGSPERGDVAIAVLAAGRGSRLGGDDAKPLLEWKGRPLVGWALDAATATGFDPIVVVTGYKRHDVGRVVSERFDGFKGVTVVHNRHWKQGIASSLHAAIDFVDPFTRVGAVCVGLADQPRVGAEAYLRLARAYADGADFVVATYEGQRANPVLLARSLWSEARALTGDVGARSLMKAHEVLEVPCGDTGSPADVDTIADLDTLNDTLNDTINRETP